MRYRATEIITITITIIIITIIDIIIIVSTHNLNKYGNAGSHCVHQDSTKNQDAVYR